MKIYSYDKEGFFTCESLADESPLEPGVWHIPARATTHAPPERTAGTRQHFGDNGWTLVEIPVETAAEVIPESELALEELLFAAIREIESAAKSAREAVIGDPTKALEYFAAEREARSFLADPSHPAGPSVQAWADACEKDCGWAAGDIVRASDSASEGLAIIRAARLRAREDMKTLASVDTTNEDFLIAAKEAYVNVAHAVHFDEARRKEEQVKAELA